MKVYKKLKNGVRIMEFEPSMAQAVADMWNLSGDGWGGDMSVQVASDVINTVSGGAYFNVYVAEHKGEIWGYASLSKYFADDDALYLHVLNVRPDKHGQKLGKELVLQCVRRTIELGFPRLDIHTWPGNTKAVPLYKKCGYMWEDRTDSTHLVNFVPTIINAPPCAAFFAVADWYAHNTRPLQIQPDGVKVNGFEMFQYQWENNGQALIVGFERTGRRMRLLETDDYRIEMTAQGHELAFGLDYECTFELTNKSAKPLHVRIKGKKDKNIRLECSINRKIEGKMTYGACFTVGEIAEPQDVWRVHPCVLAEVSINGKAVDFGLGIETRWPVSAELVELKRIATPGAVYQAYFNLTSNLRSDADIKIHLPKSPAVARFDLPAQAVTLPALGKKSLAVTAAAIAHGHEAIKAEYEIKLADHGTITYKRPLHVSSPGLTAAYGYENETDFVIQNGAWTLGLNKNGAWGWSKHVLGLYNEPGFAIGQLGLQKGTYSDEFTRMKPQVRFYPKDGDMVMEATYVSKAVAGAEYTSCYRLNAQGLFTRWHRVKNIGDAPIACGLKDETNPPLWVHTVLPVSGGLQVIHDGLQDATGGISTDLIDENWAFEAHPRCPVGICWPKEYKLNIRWGNAFFFEHELNLPPGASHETRPVVVAHGMFPNHHVFRDFALQAFTEKNPRETPHIGWEFNGGNPFAKAARWTAAYTHHRNGRLEGDIIVIANDQPFDRDGDRAFSMPATPCADRVTVVRADMRLNNFVKRWESAVFSPQADAKVTTQKKNGVLTAHNGVITFKVDPRFSDACFSLQKDNNEWLTSRYPSKEPYSWFNPFVGGINTDIADMGQAMTQREAISAAAAKQADTLGNVWQGLSTTVDITQFDKYKGISYTHYYLTLPGLPVLCYFMRVQNKSGLYKTLDLEYGTFIGKTAAIKDLALGGVNPEGIEYAFPCGHDSWWRNLHHLGVASMADREDKLYVYRNGDPDGKQLYLNTNADIAEISANLTISVADGKSHIGTPVFILLTPQGLTDKMLYGLNKVAFN